MYTVSNYSSVVVNGVSVFVVLKMKMVAYWKDLINQQFKLPVHAGRLVNKRLGNDVHLISLWIQIQIWICVLTVLKLRARALMSGLCQVFSILQFGVNLQGFILPLLSLLALLLPLPLLSESIRPVLMFCSMVTALWALQDQYGPLVCWAFFNLADIKPYNMHIRLLNNAAEL